MKHEAAHSAQPERRKLTPRRVVSTILLVVGIILLVGAGGYWLSKQWEYHEQDVENQKLASYASFPEGDDGPPQIDWAGLKALNPDIVGWIYIPNTAINYPVYQGDSNDKYLRTNAEGKYSVGGQVFLDYQNTKPGMVDQQSIIYGHHLRNGAMFKAVADMDNQTTFDATTTVWYLTEDQNYELEPLLLYYTTGSDTDVRNLNPGTVDNLRTYLQSKLASAQTSRSDAQQVIQNTQHVLTLVTCNYYQDDGRTVLLCVPKSEAQDS
ncbi:MAG: class B sortase [Coriobacteriales bacterium]|nr:class B sortase [Coriobacteriales bacterium]